METEQRQFRPHTSVSNSVEVLGDGQRDKVSFFIVAITSDQKLEMTASESPFGVSEIHTFGHLTYFRIQRANGMREIIVLS